MDLKHNCRHTNDDPFYCSTDNWKTAKQWKKLGFRLDEHLLNIANNKLLTSAIYGYCNSACRKECTRFHKRIVRKVK